MIDPDDLLVEVYPIKRNGGQHVALTEYGVKVTHLPSEVTVTVKTSKSQHRNRAIALDAILGAITSPHYRG